MPHTPCQRLQLSMYVKRMTSSKIFSLRRAAMACFLCCVACVPVSGLAQNDKAQAGSDKSKPADKGTPDKSALPPLPAEAHVQQTIQLDGKALKYTVSVGALPVRDGEGKVAGEVVVTAYTVEGANRPVTFAFIGGPGASSVYLNRGAGGPGRRGAGGGGGGPAGPAGRV